MKLENAYRNKNSCPYWGDGGAGIIPLAKTGRFLVNHRSHFVNEGGTYGVFGGGIFLDDTPYDTIEQLATSDYPKKHAKEELHEETGYNGPINLIEVYVYKDQKTNKQGLPCNFFYWTFVGIVPEEFPVAPGTGRSHGLDHKDEDGGNSQWLTLPEVQQLKPMHYGLASVLKNAGSKLASLARKFQS